MDQATELKYKVFISHAGEDKRALAAPIYHELMRRGISAFFDDRELLPGADAPLEMTQAAETAHVGLFLLSPEFLAKHWPMFELNIFLRRSEEAARQVRTPPKLIPVFYRLTIEDCKYANLIRKFHQVMHDNYFFDRMESGEVNSKDVQKSLRTLTERSGIDMKGRGDELSIQERAKLVQDVCDAVEKLVTEAENEAVEESNDQQRNAPQMWGGRDAAQGGRDVVQGSGNMHGSGNVHVGGNMEGNRSFVGNFGDVVQDGGVKAGGDVMYSGRDSIKAGGNVTYAGRDNVRVSAGRDAFNIGGVRSGRDFVVNTGDRR